MLPPFAKLTLVDNEVYEMNKERVIIGRGTAVAPVDIDVGPSSFVSRKHLELLWERNTLKLKCNGKNGIFVDKAFRPYGNHSHTIPTKCILRFPSTSIQIRVEQQRRSSAKRLSIMHLRRSRKPVYTCCDSLPDSELSSLKRARRSPSPVDLDKHEHELLLNDSLSESHSTAPVKGGTRRKQALIPTTNCLGGSTIGCEKTVGRNEADSAISSTKENGKLDRCTPDANSILNCVLSDTVSTVSSTPAFTPVLAPSNGVHVNGGRILFASLPNLCAVPGLSTTATVERGDRSTKPPYSYAQLIAQAIAMQPDRQLTLSGIYDYISQNYPYYSPHDKGWQNSVRHNLSLNRHFFKVPRSQEDHGKGSFWRVDPVLESRLTAFAFRKRRNRVPEGMLLPTAGVQNIYELPKNISFKDMSQTTTSGTMVTSALPAAVTSSIQSNTSIKLTFAPIMLNGISQPVQTVQKLVPTVPLAVNRSNSIGPNNTARFRMIPLPLQKDVLSTQNPAAQSQPARVIVYYPKCQ